VGSSAWPLTVEVPAGATHCALFNEVRELLDEPAYKALLDFTPGTYALPLEDGDHPVALPFCLTMPQGQQVPRVAEPGTVHVTSFISDGNRHVSMNLTQVLVTDSADTWELAGSINVALVGGVVPTLRLDAQHRLEAPAVARWTLCKRDSNGECTDYLAYREFDSCTFSTEPLQRHTVTFTGGSMELELRIGQSFASTEPGAFLAAHGTLDGEAFSQTDYWKLIYNPEHHHFERHLLVLLDTPRGNGTCGIRVDHLSAHEPSLMTRLTTVDCALAELSQRTITDEQVFREPRP